MESPFDDNAHHNSPHSEPSSSRRRAEAFFAMKQKLHEAYQKTRPHLQEMAVSLFEALSIGYGLVDPPRNSREFVFHRRKTYCAIELQEKCIKIGINVDCDKNWLPQTSLAATDPPKKRGNESERFVDYRLSAAHEIADALVLIDAAHKYWVKHIH